MQVTATRQEIEQASELLALLKQWEPLKKAGRDYQNGKLTLSTAIDSKTVIAVTVDIDRYRSNRIYSAVESCQLEIDALAREAAETLAEKVCDLIKKRMPIPISE